MHKKNIIVTGSSGQIGSCFVNYLSNNKGYRVYAIDKNSSIIKKTNVTNIKLDISNEIEVVNFFNDLDDIYALVNNAGIGVFTPFFERTIAEFKEVLDVNLVGTFLMCRESLKIMTKKKLGKIINIGSIYGTQSSDYRIYGSSGRLNSEVYSISKSGVIMFTKYLAAHFASQNIQINTVSPGGIKKNQTNDFILNYENKTPAGRMGKPKDLLPVLKFLLDENNQYTNGENITVDGGFLKW